MSDNKFRTHAKQSLELATEGINLLIEVSELQEGLIGQMSGEMTEQLISEIIAKEKQAISLIQRATQIQRDLMRSQHAAIEKLTERL